MHTRLMTLQMAVWQRLYFNALRPPAMNNSATDENVRRHHMVPFKGLSNRDIHVKEDPWTDGMSL